MDKVLVKLTADLRARIRDMIFDGIPVRRLLSTTNPLSPALSAFISKIERTFGATLLRSTRDSHFTDETMEPLFALTHGLRRAGIIESIQRIKTPPDEPHMYVWSVRYPERKETQGRSAAGASLSSNAHALTAAIAEATERHVWGCEDDYYASPIVTTAKHLGSRAIDISTIATFSERERELYARPRVDQDSPLLWIQGESLISRTKKYVPAQLISVHSSRHFSKKEPSIHQRTTTGLATWPTKQGARLAGALEALCTEAYLIMWLQQIAPPRYHPDTLCTHDSELTQVFKTLQRYRFQPHILRLPTDAPTHAIAVVLEDVSGASPLFSWGLSAHRELGVAVRKAVTEALRAHSGVRMRVAQGEEWESARPVEDVGHRDRLLYWADQSRAAQQRPLFTGTYIDVPSPGLYGHTEEEHLQSIIQWCTDMRYEFISVSLTQSRANVTPWHIEKVLIPQLLPNYLHETMRASGSERLIQVTKKLGYDARTMPFIDTPHPFS